METCRKMHVCSLTLNCTDAMENYSPTVVECIRKPRKLTQEEKNQWHVHMFLQCCEIQ